MQMIFPIYSISAAKYLELVAGMIAVSEAGYIALRAVAKVGEANGDKPKRFHM